MAIDPKKLAAYMSTMDPRPGRKPLPVVDKEEAKAKAAPDLDAQRERLEHGSDTTDDQLKRLLSESVGYMELDEVAKGFACGACASYEAEEEGCRNPKVKAPVSARHGCCNLYWPAHGEPAFPLK